MAKTPAVKKAKGPLFDAAPAPPAVVDEAPAIRGGAIDDDIPPQATNDIGARAIQMYQRAETLRVADDEAYQSGIEYWKRMKRMLDSWLQLHEKPVRKAKESLDAAKEARDVVAGPLKLALDSLKERCENFMTARREAQRAALAVTTQTLVQQDAATAHQAVTREFDAAIERGDEAKAARIMSSVTPNAPAIPPPPPPVPTLPKVDGVAAAEPWTYDIVDESQIPREYMMPDRKAITGVVKAMKGKTNIPGIRARPDTSLRISTKE